MKHIISILLVVLTLQAHAQSNLFNTKIAEARNYNNNNITTNGGRLITAQKHNYMNELLLNLVKFIDTAARFNGGAGTTANTLIGGYGINLATINTTTQLWADTFSANGLATKYYVNSRLSTGSGTDTYVNSASFALGSKNITLSKNQGTAVQVALTGLATEMQVADSATFLRNQLLGIGYISATAGNNVYSLPANVYGRWNDWELTSATAQNIEITIDGGAPVMVDLLPNTTYILGYAVAKITAINIGVNNATAAITIKALK